MAVGPGANLVARMPLDLALVGEFVIACAMITGGLIVIGFPDRASARRWYESPAYQEILPLRTENADGSAMIVDGVSPEHRAIEVLEQTATGG